jgi:hypothetical protein
MHDAAAMAKAAKRAVSIMLPLGFGEGSVNDDAAFEMLAGAVAETFWILAGAISG